MAEDHSESRVTVWMSEPLVTAMDEEYINWRYESRSQWVRESVETRMAVEDALATQDVDLPDDADARAKLIETVVAAGVAAADDLADRDEESRR